MKNKNDNIKMLSTFKDRLSPLQELEKKINTLHDGIKIELNTTAFPNGREAAVKELEQKIHGFDVGVDLATGQDYSAVKIQMTIDITNYPALVGKLNELWTTEQWENFVRNAPKPECKKTS